MFERFTDRARRVVVLAQEEARQLRHDYIGTEHVLLGLIREEQGVASQVLQGLGITLKSARAKVEETVGRGRNEPGGHIPFTKPAKKTLELSLREALQLGHGYIGTEHILLGLVAERRGTGAQVLESLGLDPAAVRLQVQEFMSSGQTEIHEDQPPPAPSGTLEDIADRLARIEATLDRIERRLDGQGRDTG